MYNNPSIMLRYMYKHYEVHSEVSLYLFTIFLVMRCTLHLTFSIFNTKLFVTQPSVFINALNPRHVICIIYGIIQLDSLTQQ